MTRPDLEAARLAAVSVLGRNAERTLAKLEAAGLVVIRSADLPQEQEPVTLEPVRLILREPWDGVALIWAKRPHGEVVFLRVQPEAVASVRECFMLQEVNGDQVGLELDNRSMVVRAWAVRA